MTQDNVAQLHGGDALSATLLEAMYEVLDERAQGMSTMAVIGVLETLKTTLLLEMLDNAVD